RAPEAQRLEEPQADPRRHEGIPRHEPGPARARLPFRRADHLLLAHAGHRDGERPHRRVLPPPGGRPVKAGRPLLFVAGPALAAGLALVAAAPAAAPAPAEVQAAVESSRRAQIDYFRNDPFSPMRAVRRFDFPTPLAATILGSGKEADLRLDAPGLPARLLRLTVLPPEKEDAP